MWSNLFAVVLFCRYVDALLASDTEVSAEEEDKKDTTTAVGREMVRIT